MGVVAYFVLVLAMPLVVWRCSRRLAPRASRALAWTILSTWVSAAVAFYVWVDCDSPWTLFAFAFVVLPCMIVPVSAVVTSFVLGRIIALIPAAGGAGLGWILSLLPLLIGDAFGIRALDLDHLFAGCFVVAPTSIVAASLAVLVGTSAACLRP